MSIPGIRWNDEGHVIRTPDSRPRLAPGLTEKIGVVAGGCSFRISMSVGPYIICDLPCSLPKGHLPKYDHYVYDNEGNELSHVHDWESAGYAKQR